MTKPNSDCRDLPEVVCFNRRKVADLRQRLPDPADLDVLTRTYKALAHAGRLAVLNLLAMDECCVCDVAHVLRMPVSTASQHLHALKRAGLADSRREGKLVFYFAAHERARALALPSLEGVT
jgi:ArsR family transcriptional regulator, lead/cadmium/zinc/bismuth-responsive transcriptional repressor